MAKDEKAVAIGKRIAEARKEAGGMKQEELAALISVSPRSIQAYETGEVVPYRYLRDLERALGKPAAWFLHGDAAMQARDEQLERVLEELAALRAAFDELAAEVRGRPA